MTVRVMDLRIATRRSPLAMAQAKLVAAALAEQHPDVKVEFVQVTSAGDADQTRAVEALGERGVFAKAVQVEVLAGRADLAVHSYKDLPTEPAPGLVIGAVPERADARDALVARTGVRLRDLPSGARLGTGSARRSAQIRRRRPDLQIVPLRGSVGTRVQRVLEGDLEATILALAGLQRAGLRDAVSEFLEPPDFLPAPAQGALAVEVGDDRTDLLNLVAEIDDATARAAVSAERAFLAALGGGCTLPAGALARIEADTLMLQAGLFGPGAGDPVTVSGGTADAAALGREAARHVLATSDAG